MSDDARIDPAPRHWRSLEELADTYIAITNYGETSGNRPH